MTVTEEEKALILRQLGIPEPVCLVFGIEPSGEKQLLREVRGRGKAMELVASFRKGGMKYTGYEIEVLRRQP